MKFRLEFKTLCGLATLVFLLNCPASAAKSYQLSCTESNRANPNTNPRRYTIQMNFPDTSSLTKPLPAGSNFFFGSAKVLRQELNRQDSSVLKTTVLIEKIPCTQAKDSSITSCALEEKLPRGKISTAKFHLKTHTWEFLRWKEGTGPEREIPLLVKTEEVHFFIENLRFRNDRGERQPLVLTKRFRKSHCQFID